MSSAEIETLRAGYEAAGRRDWDAVFLTTHPDFELTTADVMTNAGTFRGTEEARKFFEDLVEPFDEVMLEPEEFIQRGDQIVALLLLRSRPKGSSASFDIRIAHLWTMRDGKATNCKIYPERKDALEAIGVAEQD